MGKKITTLCMAIVGIGGGVWLYGTLHGPTGPRVTDPFSQPYKLSRDSVAFYTEGDTMKTIVYSGPFYWGATQLPGNRASEYDEARRKKIDEMLGEAAKIRKAATELRPELDAMRSRILDFLAAGSTDRGLAGFGAQLRDTMLRNNAVEAASEMMQDAVATPTAKDPYGVAMLEEHRVMSAVATAICYLDDITFLTAAAALCDEAGSASSDSKLKQAAQTLAGEMQKLGGVSDNGRQLADSVAKIEFGYRQIRTGDYRYAKGATEYVKTHLPALQKALANAKPSKDVDKDDIALAKAYLSVCGNWAQALDGTLAKFSKGLISDRLLGGGAGLAAWADDIKDEYAKAFRALNSPAEGVSERRFLPTWDETKTAFHKLQRGVQLTTDTMGNGWDAMTRAAAGAYYGDTWKEIKTDLAAIGKRQSDNWQGKPLQKTTLRKGKEYLDAVEADAEAAAAEYAKSKGAGAWTSWGVGKVGKVLVGTFTGVGKGIMLISDPNSTTADYVEGSMELLLASIGGSKTLLKARQVPGFTVAAGEEALQAGKLGWAALMRNRLGNQIARLRELIPNMNPEELISNNREIIAKLVSMRAWEDAMAVLKNEIGDAMKAGMKAGWENAKSTAAQSWEDMWKEYGPRTLRNQLGTMWQTLTGEGVKDAWDNYWGAIADDWIKGQAIAAMAGPKPEEIGGTYVGTATFTRIDLPKNPPPKTASKGEGCDIDLNDKELIKGLLDKPLPITIVLTPSSGDAGHITFGGPSSKKRSAAVYRYYPDGTIRATFKQGGEQFNLDARIKDKALDGTLSGSAKGAFAEATVTGTRRP